MENGIVRFRLIHFVPLFLCPFEPIFLCEIYAQYSGICHSEGCTKEFVRIYKQIMQNKANLPHFSSENDDYAKKQTQFKPNQSQFSRAKKNERFYVDKDPNDDILYFSRGNLPPYKGANIKSCKAKTNPKMVHYDRAQLKL